MSFVKILEISGLVIGLLYLYLEFKAYKGFWFVGMLMNIIGFTVYYSSGLFGECALEIFYFSAAIYGVSKWFFKVGKQKKELAISRISSKTVIILGCILIPLYFIVLWFLIRFTPSTVPYFDALSVSLSLIGYYIMSNKYVEHWLVWIGVDFLVCALSIYKGIPFYAALYACYCIVAGFGFKNWLKIAKSE